MSMEESNKTDSLNNQDDPVPLQPKKQAARKKKSHRKTNGIKDEFPKEQDAKEKEYNETTLIKEPKHEDNASTAKKKRSRNKRKGKTTAVERHAVSENETGNVPEVAVKSQPVEVFDYEELERALGGPVKLDQLPPVYFAPEKNFINPEMAKSHSAPVSNESKMNFESKKKSTAAQGKGRSSAVHPPKVSVHQRKGLYSAVPPPESLTNEQKSKSKKSKKQDLDEVESHGKKSDTEKHSKKKPMRKDTESEFKISAPSVKLPGKKDKKSFSSERGALKAPPIAFVKSSDQAKDNKPVVLDKSIKPAALSNEVSKSTDKKPKKETPTKKYCHPYDIVYGRSRNKFNPYLDPKVCEERMKEEDPKIFKGVLRINKRNPNDAYVTTDTLEADIFILGIRDRNRALEGDTVLVELVDLDAVWERKKESMAKKRKDHNKEEIEIDDEKLKPKFAGKVVSISDSRKDRVFSGIISVSRNGFNTDNTNQASEEDSEIPDDTANEDMSDHDSQPRAEDSTDDKKSSVRFVWFKPSDKRAPLITIPIKQAPFDILENEEKYKKLLVVVKIQRWSISSLNPMGMFVRELGHVGNIPAETEAILLDNNISELPFTKKALNGLPTTPWSIEQSQINKRRDLRETRIFTIDPITAKDLDDAVHVTKLAEDEFEVGVHIADVSHFIKQHTALDHEAFDRGTSTYLCDRVIPMLPSLLCEELCSLNPGVDRLAFSVIWKMDSAGNIKDTWFGKTVIRSCAKLAYEDAQSVIEGHGLPENVIIKNHKVSEVEKDISYLLEMSKKMRKRRFSNGALSINSIRLSFKLNELGEPCEVSIYEQKDANRLIEEFMLRANMSVAEKINEHYPNEALLRQHSPPHEKSLNEFIRIAENLGYKFDGSSAASIQESFNAIESEDAKEVLKLLAVKPMQRAKYFCTGTCEEEKFRHYALNVPLYTHFTSPIRRFPDIIVHRQLEAAILGKKTCQYKKEDIQKTAAHCNERKEGAKNSQDMNLQLYLSHYLYNLEKELGRHVVCTAIVTQVLKDAFDVLLPEYGIEKRIHMDSIPITKYSHDEEKNSQQVYWKEGVDSSWEWDQRRKNIKSGIETVDKQVYSEKMNVVIPKELLVENVLDKENRMQRFDTFSKLNVRIQVNVERSPPIVNIYPINPFM